MMKGSYLLNVKCKEIIEQIFSHLKTVHILKLIKYNKSLLNRIGITKEIFKNNSDLPKYEYKKISQLIKKKVYYGHNYLDLSDTDLIKYSSIFNFCFSIIIISYIVVYALLSYIVQNAFLDEYYSEEIYDMNSIGIIKLINISLFILEGLALINFVLIILFVCRKCQYDVGFKKYLKKILIIFILAVHLFFEFLVIYKIYLIYYISNTNLKPGKSGVSFGDSDCKRFVILDYIFIIINFIYIIYFIIGIYIFLKYLGKNVEETSKFILISYNKIKLKDFELPSQFESFNKLKRKNYIQENANNFQYYLSEEQLYLLDLINSFREKYGVPKYNLKSNPKIPSDMLILPSEAIFFGYKNIFKIGNNKYILKYPFGEFKKKLIRGDNDILKIITKDNLDKIQIINRETENEYIYIWESDDDDSESFSYLSSDDIGCILGSNSYAYSYKTVNLRESLLSE